ncbi:RNA polymerase sigma factor [Wenyingzhuangia sp. 2_MG-2023]|uniref:RNA polymerase sigma factor n=1 Tax=Wenyingzhuangia sp. 2_MG-2023 TaxID=3062639 RepID=UPI0026E370F9|nr:RNA polymerase sigma-70 factor [Wenyingzhuangia sp. 2_MG-2023]MDO6738708.1 RNA polymerase sigma-70 factor [Wenyingzhuangia sp. 2_MG-2023]MDO6802375.1 RNA polymerase sigma-70 factor [Wenyingzhuangia sp. 1_MG-2023]
MPSNVELAKRIANSDEIAFSSLYNRLWEKLFVFAQSLIMDEVEAKDVIQEVWLDYWKRRGEISTDNIDAFLYQAVRYKVYNTLRDKKFNKVQLEVCSELSMDAPVELNHDLDEVSMRLNYYVNLLPTKCREIFTLSRYQGLDNEEIADKIGISKRTVENQLSIAVKSIRNNMGKAVSVFFFILNC